MLLSLDVACHKFPQCCQVFIIEIVVVMCFNKFPIGSDDYTTAIDVWAVGCVMGELLRGRYDLQYN